MFIACPPDVTRTYVFCAFRILWFAKTRSCGFSNESPIPKSSVELENEGGVAEVNQHRMVLEVKPATKDLKTTVLRPSRFVVEPP